MIKVKDLKQLEALRNHDVNELALVEDENAVYIYGEDGNWTPYKPGDGGLTLSLYDINKMVIPNLPDFTDEDFEKATQKIKNFIKPGTKFWMMLSNEKRYFTLFQLSPNKTSLAPKIEEEAIACLKTLGTVKSVELTEDGQAIEMWVIDNMDETPYVYYLFNYDKGVIICR